MYLFMYVCNLYMYAQLALRIHLTPARHYCLLPAFAFPVALPFTSFILRVGMGHQVRLLVTNGMSEYEKSQKNHKITNHM